ncbi:hypothetical protein [Undibacterium sp. Ren11W]|uniref:hypothetical protein n=1 Tax=Undibacterium sp. Ren11W TaxID=3413045 RepID=UPI003BF257D4
MKKVIFSIVSLVVLAFIVALLAGFVQNESDFAFGNFDSFEATLINKGGPHSAQRRPRYYPVFLSRNGQRIKLDVGFVATELPQIGETVMLRCARSRPGNCRTSSMPDLDPVFWVPATILALLLSVVFCVLGLKRIQKK